MIIISVVSSISKLNKWKIIRGRHGSISSIYEVEYDKNVIRMEYNKNLTLPYIKET